MQAFFRGTLPYRWGAVAAILIGGSVVGTACSGDDDPPTSTTVGLANPASVFCEQQGGTVEIVEESDGQRGVCVLPDGRRVDEWEYFQEQTGSTSTSP